MIVEAAGTSIIWTNPADLDVTQTPVGVNLPGSRPGRSDGLLSSHHPGGTHVALADGSVQFFSEKIHPAVLRRITSANANDPVEF